MKIAIISPKKVFTDNQQKQLNSLGEVLFIEPPQEYDADYFKEQIKGAEVLAADPDNLGGFEKAKKRLTDLMETLPNLKGLALDTTSFGWVDLDYCKRRGIPVCNVPGYSRESVAELTLTLLLGVSLKLFLADRRTQKGKFELEGGNELKGKTLGVLGLGNIGSRTAELGSAIGMRVIAHNRSPKTQEGVEMKAFDEVITESDYIVIHLTHTDENKNLISKEQISKMKNGVIIVNTADRDIINEEDLAEALKSGKVGGYAYEGEDLENTPLAKIENAFGFKAIAWYSKEARENLIKIWVNNIENIVKGTPKNIVQA
jgi:glycerate dehydrogenase